MGISMADIKEKLEVAYLEEDWHIVEELIEAEKTYSARWIEEAFREAVGNNKRNWRYIARILERWESEGKQNGTVGRYPKKNSYY